MKRLGSLIWWEWRLQLRYHIVTVASVVTVLYIWFFRSLPIPNKLPLLITLVFTDPALLAFMFIGAMVLFEKSSGTHLAVAVSPIRPHEYLLARMVSLSMIGTMCGVLMTIAAHGWAFHIAYLWVGIFSASLLFAGLGYIGVLQVRSFNQFMMWVPILMVPLWIPLLILWGIPEYAWFYLFPTHASLIFFRAAFEPVSSIDLVYASLYLPVSLFLLYRICLRVHTQKFLHAAST